MRNNLRCLRRQQNLTQENISERLGLSLRQYRRMELGDENGALSNWYKLKEILNAPSIDYLLQQVSTPHNNPTTSGGNEQGAG